MPSQPLPPPRAGHTIAWAGLAAGLLAGLSLISGCAVHVATVRAPGAEIHRFELSISNVYAIETEGGVVLVDAGDPEQEGDVLGALERVGVDPAQVRLIVVTHAHADHIGSARALAEALDVPVALQRADVPIATAGHNPELHPTNVTAVLLLPTLRQDFPAFEPSQAFDACLDLAEYGVAGVVISAPGHTPGSSVVMLEGGDAIVGDLFAGGYLGGMISAQVPTEHYYQQYPRRVRAIMEWLLSAGVRRFHIGHGGPVEAADLRTALAGGDLGPPPAEPFVPPTCH